MPAGSALKKKGQKTNCRTRALTQISCLEDFILVLICSTPLLFITVHCVIVLSTYHGFPCAQPWWPTFEQATGTRFLSSSFLHPLSPFLIPAHEVFTSQTEELMKVDTSDQKLRDSGRGPLLHEKPQGLWGQWSTLPGLASLGLRSWARTWLSHLKPVNQDSSGPPAHQVPGFKGPSVSQTSPPRCGLQPENLLQIN